MSFAGLFLKIFIIKFVSTQLFPYQLPIDIIFAIFLKKTYKISNLPNKGLTFVLKDDTFLEFRGRKMKDSLLQGFSPKKSKATNSTVVRKNKRTPSVGKTKKTVVNKPTTVVANIDVGFGNRLFIRGNGCGLTWDKGIEMSLVNGNCWKWESKDPNNTTNFEFKILLNDELWSTGDNYLANKATMEITPVF